MKKVTTAALVGLCALGLTTAAGAQSIPQLNEIVMNDVSTDDMEFVEICGDPDSDLSAFTFCVIEGEGTTTKGRIDVAIGLSGLIGASGLYVLGDVACADQAMSSGTLENGAQTMLLVRNFTGSVGDDIDMDDDCTADGPFPGMIVDSVATTKPSSGDCAGYYGAPTLGPDTGDDGTADFDVAGVARCEDCTGSWGMICLAGTEGDPVCFDNNPDGNYNVAAASPCSGNLCAPISVDETTWGMIKGSYR